MSGIPQPPLRAELLAEFILSHIAFVTRVPRQEDVGYDLLCSLIEREKDLLKAGPFFTIQIKANNKPIIYSKKHELEWIAHQENPFFIGVANYKTLKLHIYSTWNMLNAFLLRGTRKVRFLLKMPSTKGKYINYNDNNSCVDIYLGKPIISLSAKDMANEKIVVERTQILKQWVLIDRENIVRRAAKMYWVIGPMEYNTNQSVRSNLMRVGFFWNTKNFSDCMDNFFRASIALLLVMKRGIIDDSELFHFRSDLSHLLQSNLNLMDPIHVKILKQLEND